MLKVFVYNSSLPLGCVNFRTKYDNGANKWLPLPVLRVNRFELVHEPVPHSAFREVHLNMKTHYPFALAVLFVAAVLSCTRPGLAQGLIISEASAANTVFTDEDEEANDWIELYNAGNDPVDLGGYRLRDRPGFGGAWRLPGQALGGGEHLRIWASGKDRAEPGNAHVHTDFRLASAGETVFLFAPSGTIVDELPLVPLPANTSRGRNASGELVFFATPTPGSTNEPFGATALNPAFVSFSHPGGPSAPLSVGLEGADAGAIIRFTTDGSTPNDASPAYTTPLQLETTTAIRAAVFKPGTLRGPVSSATYVIDRPQDLPVITLTTDPSYFFSNDLGIYVPGPGPNGPFPYYGANYWRDWERPVDVALYSADGTLETSFPGGAKIFGGNNRTRPQRSLSVFARKVYGAREIDHALFPDRSGDTYQAFVLRNSGNDWNRTMFRDAMMTGLMEGSGIDYQAYRPVVVYLNGRYWGIHNMREKVNEHSIAAHHSLDPDEVNLLELDGTVLEGNEAGYPELVTYFQENDFRQPAAFAHADSLIDLDNLIRYNVAQIYFGNSDWPHNNVKFWRTDSGKWRWILFDTDYGFGHWGEDDVFDDHLTYTVNASSRGWPNQRKASLFLRELLRNEGFRNRFINQFADEMNARFLPSAVSTVIDSLADHIETEIPRHFQRWGTNEAEWAPAVEGMHRFGELRPEIMKQHIASYFNLAGYHSVRVTNETPRAGSVELNSLQLRTADWTGDYFANVPISLTAVPDAGYKFVCWTGDTISLNPRLSLNPAKSWAVTAVFERQDPGDEDLQLQVTHLLPNPSAGQFLLGYRLAEEAPLTVDIIDVRGRVARRLWSGEATAGENSQLFECTDLPPGVYFVRITREGQSPVSRRWVKH